jgi:phosphoribosylformylglycinamidine synthase
VDLTAERAAGELIRRFKAASAITAAHDLSDGGLALAAAEMALAGNTGIALDADATLPHSAWFFGEDQARYLVACPDAAPVLALAAESGVPARTVGRAGGTDVALGASRVSLAALRAAHETSLAHLIDGTTAATG